MRRITNAKAGRRRRTGFTLVEVAVASVIVALLAAVTVPSIAGYLDHQRASTTATELAAIATGISAFETAVKTAAAATSNTYPGLVSELDTVVTATSTVTHNSCGSNTPVASVEFTTTAVTNWNANGPFLSFYVPRSGYVTPIGTMLDSIERVPLTNPVTAAQPGTLRLIITNVDTNDAIMLDQTVDNGDGGTKGTVQYTGTSSRIVTVKYMIPAIAKC